jgi:hypothetical protein
MHQKREMSVSQMFSRLGWLLADISKGRGERPCQCLLPCSLHSSRCYGSGRFSGLLLKKDIYGGKARSGRGMMKTRRRVIDEENLDA